MRARFFALAASLLLVACGAARPETPPPETPPSVTSPPPSGADATEATEATAGTQPAHDPSSTALELWRTRCNQCHVRVEPKTRERAVLAQALERHRKRARLSESDVRGLVDYLAK